MTGMKGFDNLVGVSGSYLLIEFKKRAGKTEWVVVAATVGNVAGTTTYDEQRSLETTRLH